MAGLKTYALTVNGYSFHVLCDPKDIDDYIAAGIDIQELIAEIPAPEVAEEPMETKLKIGYALYEIVMEHNPTADNQLCRGTIEWKAQKIALDPSLNPRVMLQTFFHEMGHAIGEHYSVGFTEEQVDQYAEGLAQVVLDNYPLLMRFIKPCLE